MKRYPIGFHLGPGGNPTGIGEYMRRLDEAGIAAYIKSTDHYGPVFELMEIARESGIKHTGTFRLTTAGQNDGYDYDVPPYSMTPNDAAYRHWQATVAKLPPEYKGDSFHKSTVWLEVINEVDKNRASWLSAFSLKIAQLAVDQGYRIALPSWSGGEPEKQHWSEMTEFIKYASANPDRVALSIHEYSFNVSDLWEGYPWLIGRFHLIHEICDALGVPYPTITVTEGGWTYNDAPAVSQGMPELKKLADLYYQYRNILGVGVWYLGGGFGSIANKVQPYIAPVTEAALAFDYTDEPPPPPPPPDPECIDLTVGVRIHALRPMVMNDNQWAYIRKIMEQGVGLPDGRMVKVGYEGWSHMDAMKAVKDAVNLGYPDSRLLIIDGDQIGTGLTRAWMDDNCPFLSPYTVFLSSSGSVEDFQFKVWPTEYKVVTQFWGARPDYYKQFGLPGHEGVDLRAPNGSKVFNVADGVVHSIHRDASTHNYGIHVRVDHKDGYQTIYAHLASVASGLAAGQRVQAGIILGLADNTGNSSGSHLHLGLKRFGVPPYKDKYSDAWPHNFHDPTPFLKRLCSSCFNGDPPPPPPSGDIKLGLHASADPALASGEIAMMQQARVEAIKILSNLKREDVSALSSTFPGVPFVIRAFLDWGGRNVTPQNFFDWTYNDVREIVGRLGNREIWVELHNEPNLKQEGWTYSWANGLEFRDWFIQVLDKYKTYLGGVKFLYPGLSPGGDVGGIRYDSWRFFDESMLAVKSCDGVGIHTYWASNWPMSVALNEVDGYISRVGSMPIWVTEASNNKGDTPQATKGNEYILYAHELGKRPTIRGVTYFVSSASNRIWGWQPGGSGEIWLNTDIPGVVGSRS